MSVQKTEVESHINFSLSLQQDDQLKGFYTQYAHTPIYISTSKKVIKHHQGLSAR